jgi:hypothetical protein
MLIDYRVCTIHPFCVNGRYLPIVQNFRGTEVLKFTETFESRDAAITAAKVAIDDWFTAKKGVV